MKKGLLTILLSGALSVSLLLAKQADKTTDYNAKVRDLIQSVVPGTKFEKYKKSIVEGFYTLYLKNGQIIYVNPYKELILFGEIYTTTGYSITQVEKQKWQDEVNNEMAKKTKVKDLLKSSFAIKFNKGSQNDYEFVVFTDPECPYCQRLESFLSDKNVTLHINYYPLPFHKNAKKWSLQVLSSKDKLKAIQTIKKTKKDLDVEVTNKAKKQLEEMIKVAQKVDVRGTPKIFVIDKKQNKVAEIINGANILKVKKYLDK